jgi:hypothetical protein
MRIAVAYEHPVWSQTLLARMVQRGLNVTAVNVADNPAKIADELERPHDLWVNRINVMPSPGRPSTVSAAGDHLLLQLEQSGQPVLNGYRAHTIGGSKAAQYRLFRQLGLATPATVAVTGGSLTPVAAMVDAADHIGYPVLIKPNRGGSGAGIARFDHRDQLAEALTDDRVDFGPDGTGVIQEIVTSVDGCIHRVEILDGNLFFGTRQSIRDGVYNYCAADGCSVGQNPTDGNGAAQSTIEIAEPDPQAVAAAVGIMAGADAWVGGVEYFLDARTGMPCFYDFNPFSNFVAGRNDELGFDPIDRFIDAVEVAAGVAGR